MTSSEKRLQYLIETIRVLRGVNGCPWDKKRTNLSLVKYLQSECNELVEAIQKNDQENICEELGDVLYILLMLTEINSGNQFFNLTDVIKGITEKLIRRHPHVFAGTTYENEEDLALQWQAIKDKEKNNNIV
jgi:tetrapyrrole methylase family protein/MazG family protein